MRAPAIAIVLAAVALAGCGSEEDDAAGVARSFLEAVSAGDGSAACRELSRSTREKLEKDETAPCPEALGELDLSGESEVTATDVFVSEARVSLPGGEYAFLGRTPEGWRISAAGCKPAGPEEPYECELES